MAASLIIVFGMPGAGKSYVAQIIADRFGYFPINGDEALPGDMKKKILEKSDVTRDMRTRFVENIIREIRELLKTKDTIVVHQALIKKHMREQLQRAYPHARFIWVECNDALLKKRYMKREYFNLGLPYLQVMIDAFEAPDAPYTSVHNDSEGPDDIFTQLASILSDPTGNTP